MVLIRVYHLLVKGVLYHLMALVTSTVHITLSSKDFREYNFGENALARTFLDILSKIRTINFRTLDSHCQ